jgi:hypothetical protein
MVQAGVEPDHIGAAIYQANYRRVLPFRFIAAARHAPEYYREIEAKMTERLAEEPKLDGKTAIVVDHSASMRSQLSERSDMTRFDAACGVAIIARELCSDASVYAFSNQVVEVEPVRGLDLYARIYDSMWSSGTSLGFAVEKVLSEDRFDRIIVVTDEQSHDRVTTHVPPRSYMINVSSYRNGVGYGRWTHIDGFSENVFRFITEAESEESTVNHENT